MQELGKGARFSLYCTNRDCFLNNVDEVGFRDLLWGVSSKTAHNHDSNAGHEAVVVRYTINIDELSSDIKDKFKSLTGVQL